MHELRAPEAEQRLSGGGFAGLMAMLRRFGETRWMTAQKRAAYLDAWSQPGALTAMLNWYRAAFRYSTPAPRNERILPPTLILWGVRDKFIGREGALRSADLCDLGELVFYDQATHWLPLEEYPDVNERIVEFARGSR